MDAPPLRDFTRTLDGCVERQFIMRTASDTCPCGYRYPLHLGPLVGKTIIRYDNSHELEKGHERHTSTSVEQIEFPGMIELIDRFEREIDHQIE